MILTIRTDKPEAEIGLFENGKRVEYFSWKAHRQLAETIHKNLSEILLSHQVNLSDITGIIIYKGPGSFTGLRIGSSVANALGYSLAVSVVAAGGENWIQKGMSDLVQKSRFESVSPDYGAPANITKAKK